MSKPRSAVADYAVYLIARWFVCAVQALPVGAARHVALALAWLAYRVDRRHREAAMDNLRHAFPGRWNDKELARRVRNVYRHFCTLLVEIIQVPRRLHVHNWRRYLELGDGETMVRALLSGRPLLIVTGHVGNWELAGYSMGLLGFRPHAIARPLDNPYLDRFLRTFRERTGQKVLAKHGDFAQMQKLLDKGGVLATLGDQDAGQRGLFVDFFGRPASTHKAVALLALEHRVPMLVVGTLKIAEPVQYRVEVADLILPEEYDGEREAVRDMTQRFTAGLERLIRTAPTQYFWLHRRWKHQPPKPRRKNAAEARVA